MSLANLIKSAERKETNQPATGAVLTPFLIFIREGRL